MSAVTQVKVLSPEIFHVGLGQGVHILEINSGTHATGESVFTNPGSESTAGKQTVHIGTWENRNIPVESFEETEEVTRRNVVAVVGSVHSRGVGIVMDAEIEKESLEGTDNLMQRDWECYAIH